MRESIKAVLSLLIAVGVIVTMVAWAMDRPDATTWALRIGAPVLSLLVLAVLLAFHWQRDKVPDYLRQWNAPFFNRGGFCFTPLVGTRDGVCYLQLYYQNQFEGPCRGRVALRPARGFFLTRPKFEAITFDIPCAGGAFGVAEQAIPVPAASQGKARSFEVGASVAFPEGRGRRLRYADGIFLRTNARFGDGFTTALVATAALGGALVLSRPAQISITLPENVAEDLPAGATPSQRELWKPGDPPLTA